VADNSFRISFKTGILFILIFLINLLFVRYFHDQSWWAYDEGFYAHVAERVLDGEVLHRDIQERHAGYINFANAAALHFFGRELVSLRYPLVFLAALQSVLVFLLFLSKGIWLAVIAAFVSTAFGFILFPNPTPNWYCLFLTVFLIFHLRFSKKENRGRILLAGFIIGTIYLFRQLTGVFMAASAVFYLLLEGQKSKDAESDQQKWAGQVILGILSIGMFFYLYRTTDWIGMLLIGIWPVCLLLKGMWLVSKPTKEVLKIAGLLLLGACLSFTPITIYHATHGSLVAWLNDTLLDVFQVTSLSYLKWPSYQYFLWGGAVESISSWPNIYKVLNGLYWMTLPLLGLFNGVFTFFALERNGEKNAGPLTLPIFACFNALVSLYSQNHLYLYYSAGLSLLGWLWILHGIHRKQAYALSLFALLLCSVAVYGHAAQPLSRDFWETMGGVRKEFVTSDTLPRCGLRIPPQDLAVYQKLMKLINRETKKDEPIFVFPNNAEIYFLSERKNPFRFYNTALGLLTEQDVEQTISKLSAHPPKLIIFHPGDKYETPQIQPILDFVRSHYDFIDTLSFFEIYRRQA